MDKCWEIAVLALISSNSLPTLAQPSRPPVQWNNPERPPISGVEHGSFRSASMGVEVGYNVYLPPGYTQGQERYPTIYFLHGAGGNENSDAGAFSALVRKGIELKQIPPVICVFPNGGMSGYADHPETKVMGETLIVRELIPHVDARYRTLARPESRVIAGFSMGGGGAVRLALKHPDLFSAAGSWAGALQMRGARGGSGSPSKEVLDAARGHVRLFLVVGDQDPTYAGHAPFLARLRDAQMPFAYRVLPGVGHNLGVYYEKTGDEMVRFLTRDFAGSARAPGRSRD